MKHPITRQKIRIVIYIGIWLILSVFQYFLISKIYGFEPLMLFIAIWVQNFILAVLFIFSWFGLRYINLETQRPLPVILNHLAYMTVVLGLWILFSQLTDSLILKNAPRHYAASALPLKLFVGVFSYLLFIAFIYLDGYYNSYLEKVKNEKRLSEVVKEAELNLLKTQMNPHFIFNSLNSISSLTMINPEKAQEMIVKLSDFLRYTVKSGNEKWVSLGEEIDICTAYLDIEKIRFGDKINFDFTVSPDSLQCQVPPMILQPLFENAIKHGVYNSLKTEYIGMKTEIQSGRLVIEIRNSFEANTESKGTQTGLRNIKERLNLMYHQTAFMNTQKEENQFIVTLNLPQKQ